MEVSSPLLAQLRAVSEESKLPSANRTELRANIEKIFEEVAKKGSATEKSLCAQLVAALYEPVAAGAPVTFTAGQLLKCFGAINQYQGARGEQEGSSACTSCAQCFLARSLVYSRVHLFSPAEINSTVIDGKRNYRLLQENAQNVCKTEHNLPRFQALSHAESRDVYGLRPVLSEPGQVLQRGEEGSTKAFFEAELAKVEQLVQEHRRPLGGIIHAQGKTYALTVYQAGEGFEYVLFDSHGNSEHNGGNEGAYVWLSNSQAEMAQALSSLIPYLATNLSGISADQKVAMERGEGSDVERIHSIALLALVGCVSLAAWHMSGAYWPALHKREWQQQG